MAEVKLEGLRKCLGNTEVLAGVTLTVRDGEIFTVVGPSGCGKSTLLHLIAGLDSPTAGRILFDGRDVTSLAPRERDVALVFQSYALYPHMTVAENLSFPLRVAGRRRDRATIDGDVRRMACLLGLETLLERRPRELSGGQRQRVALGRALIRRPRVFLLDEPLSNLDAQLRAGMRAELRRLHDQEGITMIYVTHDQTEAMTLADRVAVLDRGRLQQVGLPQDLYDRPENLFVAGFIGYPRMNVLDAVVRNGRLRSSALALPLPSSGLVGGFGEGSRVKLGIRPEHIRVTSKNEASTGSSAEGRWIDGMVRLIEHTGSQIWATIEINDSGDCLTLVGSISAGCSVRLGERVLVTAAEDFPHVFDATTGRALGAG